MISDVKMARKRVAPKIVVEKHENYRTIIESGVYGGHRPGFFEWIVYTDEIMADDPLSTIPPDPTKVAFKRTLQCRLMLTAIEAKNLAKWLNEHLKLYEKSFGKIPEPPSKGAMKQPSSGMIV